MEGSRWERAEQELRRWGTGRAAGGGAARGAADGGVYAAGVCAAGDGPLDTQSDRLGNLCDRDRGGGDRV